MKSICFESLKREKLRFQKPPKPKSLDPSWYTDNIYSNHSIDLDEDYIPDCLKYNTYRKLRDINENDEYMKLNRHNITTSNCDLDRSIYNSPYHHSKYSPSSGFLQRSKSCKDFKIQPAKSRSCCFGGYDPSTSLTSSQNKIKSIKVQVPKSYSFSGGNRNGIKIKPFDIIDYDLPIESINRREKKSARKSSPLLDYYCNEPKIRCWEHCTNSKCLLEEICNYNRKMNRDCSDRRAYNNNTIRRNIIAEWEERNRQRPIPLRYSTSCDEHCYRRQNGSNKRRACCTTQDYNLDDHCSSFEDEYCPANGGHYHRRSDNYYDTDLDNFIRDERTRLMNQDKFLDDDEIFLHTDNYQPMRNKSMLEVQPPSKYDDTDDDENDDDNGSESTEMELEDFNFDIERYWEELDKPPSPIDLDMQQRNMNINMKTKNVNVGCYNNGMPITDHDRKQERLLIKKSLLEGMPSPPQLNQHQNNTTTTTTTDGEFMNYFYQNGSPTFQGHQQQQQQQPHHHNHHHQRHNNRYTSHKIYPIESRPIYKYNNFYPHDNHVNNNNNINNNNHNNNNNHSNPISLINNIFSIYKPNKYSPLNCQLNKSTTGIISKKMNIPSTIRPLGAIPQQQQQHHHQHYHHQNEYLTNSMKRPLIVSTEQPHFKIIPEKTGLKISPLFDYGDKKNKHNKLKSTNRPLIFPH